MADTARKVTVSKSSHDEDDLPLPPPPPPPPGPARSIDDEGPNNLPMPPPKETFSTYYQQRQKTELKRLFKHIHPNILGELGDAVDDEIMKAVQLNDTEASDDVANQGEVQSMRWIFENWNLDSIGDPHETKKLLHEEDVSGGNVKGTSSMFEYNASRQQTYAERQTSVRGDVRTSTWLFETQPLDSLNKKEDNELVEAVLKDAIQPGDVSGTRLLFETKPLSDLGRCNSIEDHNFLKLRSELQEQKGDVQKTVKLFQAEEPRCAIRDKNGNIHSVKSICREEIKNGNTSSARWLFETQQLDPIKNRTDGVKIIRGISLEERHRGATDGKRWMFETQSFDDIREVVVDQFEVDVPNKTKLFEMQPLETLRGNSEEKYLEKENIIGGDVKTSLWLFETQPMETLNDSYQVGSLKKVTVSADETGTVQDKKIIFENCGGVGTGVYGKEQDIEKGDVRGFKQLFETIPLSKISHFDENFEKENPTSEDVPLYALKDSCGNFHEVTTVNREELIHGKVQNYKWMFETKPLNEFTDGKENVEVIKGITRQEDTTGDVKLAKWIFETQTIDGIHSKFNHTEPSDSLGVEPCKGNVKTCKWLFETQPMDVLYDKSDRVKDTETVDNPKVKSITWLFESQPLDHIGEGEDYNLRLCVKPETGLQTAKHLIETETLDRLPNDPHSDQDLRCVSQVNVQSGDVSRVKELFESQSLDEIGSEMSYDERNHDDTIRKGSVHKFTWLFENCSVSTINKDDGDGDDANKQKFSEDLIGDVKNKKFIFETSSLDQIHQKALEQKSVSVEEPISDIDVKSSTMMFESLPLYAIRDKEGQFHEVTTVKKEEILSGDVRGARWMFETKPLEAIKAENEVYVIRAVTQEDVEKGDVKSARWRFETQPLDSLTCREEPSVKVIEDFGSGNVQLNKKRFESDDSNKFVRMVSVTDVQRGDVRTSTWLFENQTIDSLKGEPEDQNPVKTVFREDSQKGDVKRCTWLFESQPLDKIKQHEETSFRGTDEKIPKTDVKCTTWLFETTPLDKITSSSITDTLVYLNELRLIHSGGIIIEANESGNVTMAKFHLGNTNEVQIQKEEVVEGNLRNIILQLLLKPTNPEVNLLRETEKGQLNSTVVELPIYDSSTAITLERDQTIQNIVKIIDEEDTNFKNGILMQETSGGQAQMFVYSLINHNETKTKNPAIEKGDVKSAIGNLFAIAHGQKSSTSYRINETEKGNVNLYKSCIEKGDLNFLRSLHSEVPEDEDEVKFSKEQTTILQGDIREAKKSLSQQRDLIERTISDVLPGDVKNTKKVFSSECAFVVENSIPRNEIIPGDVSTAKQQLAVKPAFLMEKEEIVAGDVKATMQSLERAKQQSMHTDREVVTPGTIYDMDLSNKYPETEELQEFQKETIICGDVKAAKKSLENAKQQSMNLERDVVVPGKIYNLEVPAQEGSSSAVTQSSPSGSRQVKTYLKVSDAVKSLENVPLDACKPGTVSHCDAVIVSNNKPLLSYEFNGVTSTHDDPEDVIKGDIKAAIRSLQSAATEQKLPDKEDIIGANIHLALQSLEKSKVNISKGDFKSAMLYRKSGCSERSVVVPLPPSDTTLSPSISVTCEEKPSVTTHHHSVENQASSEVGTVTPPRQKPALPPKPHWTKPKIGDHLTYQNAKKHPSNGFIQETRCSDSQITKSNTTEPTIGDHLTYQNAKKHPSDGFIEETRCSDSQITKSNPTEPNMERNVIQKINASEEIQKSIKDHEDNTKHEMNKSLKDALKNFNRTGSETLNIKANFLPSKKMLKDPKKPTLNTTVAQNSKPKSSTGVNPLSDIDNNPDSLSQIQTKNKVVLREKKVKETEDERRQRLSVHKDEIMTGNVKAAMEIFENIRKREELKGILSQVQEIESESSNVDMSSLKTFYNTVPAWMVSPSEDPKKVQKKVEVETQDDDLESVSSVETAFEDLEKASKEILNLKEQTLAKLLDIEEAIKKALYSVSNLKSEADIAGLSGLFDESLKSDVQPGNKLRKISIGTTKVKSCQSNERINRPSPPKKESPKLIRKSSSQSSPSFISIHSAARRPSQQHKPTMSTFKPTLEDKVQSSEDDPTQTSSNIPSKRNVSVLEVQKLPKEPSGIVGTKTVSETYEETDGFGNSFVSSVKSTFVTTRSDGQTAALFEVVGNPSRYEVTTSPLPQRSTFQPEDEKLRQKEMFVTFSQPPNKQH
uniref:xin actin-binding repeat-containing protein 1 n=1 Tax=Doryrhamphus excisus TaxID=161450 RepID=UPI0025AEB171|nr:xin actin-binding repeat-containing protein 1 [Doryrhamphus excisus]